VFAYQQNVLHAPRLLATTTCFSEECDRVRLLMFEQDVPKLGSEHADGRQFTSIDRHSFSAGAINARAARVRMHARFQ
jgi:hypothetical protein